MKNIVFAITFCLILINTDLFSQELNGPTSWDILGDVFSQPNVHLQVGKKKYEWYGSGDVNNDEVINNKDLEAMLSGTQNDMSDIDGDGMSSTSIDRTILQNYLNENIEHLPSHWNLLVTEDEKINWLEKMIAVEDVYKYNSDKWICENFIQQMEIDFYGISNIEKFVNEQKAAGEVEYYKPHNARFNLPLQYFATVNTNGKPYAVGGVLVGENPLNFYDWYFISMKNLFSLTLNLLFILGLTNCTTTKTRVSEKDSFHKQHFITKNGQHIFILTNQPTDPASIHVLVSNDVLTPNEYYIDCDKLSKGCHAEINQSWSYSGKDNVVRFNYKFPKNKLVIIKYK